MSLSRTGQLESEDGGGLALRACNLERLRKRTGDDNPIQQHCGLESMTLWPPRAALDWTVAVKGKLCVDAVYTAKCGMRKKVTTGRYQVNLDRKNWNAVGCH